MNTSGQFGATVGEQKGRKMKSKGMRQIRVPKGPAVEVKTGKLSKVKTAPRAKAQQRPDLFPSAGETSISIGGKPKRKRMLTR